MEKANKFLGNLYIGIGWAKGLIGIVSILQLIGVLLGGSVGTPLTNFAGLVAIIQLILGVISFVMIFVCLNDGSKAFSGYLLGLVGLILELIFSGFLLIFLIFFIAVIYINAGIKNNGNKEPKSATTKQIKDTDWFYSEKNKGDFIWLF